MSSSASRAEQPEEATAEALMRSRFAAFKRGDVSWIRQSWHPAQRPATLDLDDDVQWRGLQIVDVVDGGVDDEHGVVEFRATYKDATGHGVLHERSRFTRLNGRWVYVDGDILD